MTQRYATPAAFKQAVEHRLRNAAAGGGLELARARQRLVFLKTRMAAYENHVADYYLRRGAYVAALNRAKAALEEYNGSDGNRESLRIMAEAYEQLGMMDLAADTRRVLDLNYPGEG